MQTIASSTTPPGPRAAPPRNGVSVWTRRVVLALLVVLFALTAAARSIRLSRPHSTGGQPSARPVRRRRRLQDAYVLHRQQTVAVPPWCWKRLPRHHVDLGLGAARARHRHARVRLRPGRAGLERRGAGAARRPQHARELHALLQNAGVAGPYVLVGHSLGGLSVRMYADQYPTRSRAWC